MLTKLTVHTQCLQDGDFFITAYGKNGEFLHPSRYSKQLFAWDEASFYGSFLRKETVNGEEGIKLNGFELLSLFSQDHFISFIDWHWDEMSFLCLTVAPSLRDSIEKGIPVPLFSQIGEQNFTWPLPDAVLDEFDSEFWEQIYIQNEKELTARSFTEDLYNSAVRENLQSNPATKERWATALQSLQQIDLSADALQTYFTEERWNKWLYPNDMDIPFTTGLRLIEPEDGEGPWSLEVIIRSKKNADQIKVYGKHKLLKAWTAYEQNIKDDIVSWTELVPMLNESGTIKKQLTEQEAWEFLTDASEKLLFIGASILLPSWWTELRQSGVKVKARIKGASSHGPSFVGMQALMDFDWRISMNGADLSEDDFQKLVSEKRHLIYINGQWIKLDTELIRHIQKIMKTAEKSGISIRDVLQQELATPEEIDAEEDLQDFMKIQFELNKEMKKMFTSLRELKSIPMLQPPSTLHGDLRPYQVQGLSWLMFLRQYGFGACLADDMGLGKTVQIISYLLSIQSNPAANQSDLSDMVATNAALIIAPTSVLGNWQKELERFAPSLKVALYYGAQRPKGEEFIAFSKQYDVILTTYGMSYIDFDDLKSVYWNSVIIDEAQNIKNAGTKQSRSVRKLKGAHHVALTGTPMENRLSELWAIFDFINKGYLGSLKTFSDTFVTGIERDGSTDKVKELQSIIQPFLLRRTKKDREVALNLPDKIEQKEFVPLTSEQASLYEQLIKDTFDKIDQLSSFERKGLILQMIGRLKQLCNHPALYLKEEFVHSANIRSGKLDKLLELVHAVMEQQESCLIFTQYIGMGQMIQSLLQEEYGLKVPFLTGSLGKKQRDDMIERFQNGDFPIFILSLKAGGTGLNLTAANHVIHYDRWWNPAVENQATDRAYRIGQNRFVHVHKLICTGTLEEKIDKMIDQKQALNDEILTGENWITEMTTDELKELVSLQI